MRKRINTTTSYKDISRTCCAGGSIGIKSGLITQTNKCH